MPMGWAPPGPLPMAPPSMLPSPKMLGPSSRPSRVGEGSGGAGEAGGPHSVRHMGQEVFLSSHCCMQPLQKTCLLGGRRRLRVGSGRELARRRAKAMCPGGPC